MTHEAASQALGSSRSAVSNLLRLLNLPPPVQELLMEGKIDMGHGRALLSLPPAKQIETANLVAHKQLSVRETEQLVRRLLRPNKSADKQLARAQAEVSELTEQLQEKLGQQASVKHLSSGKGRVVIQYSNVTELKKLLSRIK